MNKIVANKRILVCYQSQKSSDIGKTGAKYQMICKY